jgi:hypothetical protein
VGGTARFAIARIERANSRNFDGGESQVKMAFHKAPAVMREGIAAGNLEEKL